MTMSILMVVILTEAWMSRWQQRGARWRTWEKVLLFLLAFAYLLRVGFLDLMITLSYVGRLA
jgi:hypothetical protein